MTSSQWATLTKSSADTALRDINDLISRGILVREPGGGRSTGYTLTSIDEQPLRCAPFPAMADAQ